MAVDNSNTVMSELRDSGKAQFAYTPYGRRTVQGESNNPLAFNGEILDTPTDCYLLGSYRLASPAIYIFYSEDDQSPFGKGGLNSKAYCAGDPVNNVDPTGHFPVSRLLYPALAIGAAASIATHIAKALVNDPKAQKILGISNMVIDFAAGALLGGVLARRLVKAPQLQNNFQPSQRTINSQQTPAVSNSVLNAPAFSRQRQIPSSVNENVYFMSRTNKVVLQYSPQPALQNPEPPAYSQVAGVTSLNSAQRWHSSPASSDTFTMREIRQNT
ncbi:RHS repeat-associated core domain-containing protein [Pseudomonas putida]|uniref:RHS repeat-associated core domain-containing protein n=1 Tax=Pseudomonas putida TaxID=303 RepID=UPI0013747E45|nr:RHS repeat-associated core domain-containing protein [Pseudomonas putida]